VSKLLGKFNVKAFFTLAKKCLHILTPVKDGLDLMVGVCKISVNMGTTVTNQNLIQEEIKRRLSSGNACYHSVLFH
jgi:hypothetical protein